MLPAHHVVVTSFNTSAVSRSILFSLPGGSPGMFVLKDVVDFRGFLQYSGSRRVFYDSFSLWASFGFPT